MSNNSTKPVFPMKLCISKLSEEDRKNDYKMMTALYDWITVNVENEEDFKKIIQTFPYGTTEYRAYPTNPKEIPLVERGGKMVKESQRTKKYASHILPHIIAFDIDDDLSLKESSTILDRLNLKYATMTTKSHGIKGDSDRYRLFIPLALGTRERIEIHEMFREEKSKHERVKYAETMLNDFEATLKAIAFELFEKEGLVEASVLNEETGEFEKKKVPGMICPVDFAPMMPPGKLYPSPENAIWNSTLLDESRNPLTFDTTSGMKKRIYQYIEQSRENSKKKEIIIRKAHLKAANNSYEWFKERKNYPVVANEAMMKAIPLETVISFYEDSVIHKKAGGKDMMIIRSRSDENHEGAAYHINLSPEGVYLFHDYKDYREIPKIVDRETREVQMRSLKSGSIVEYMFYKFKEEFNPLEGTQSPMRVARKLQKDLKTLIPELKNTLMLDNPAYYLEPYIEALVENKKDSKGIIEDLIANPDMRIKGYEFKEDYTQLIVTKENGWKINFNLEEKESGDIKRLLSGNGQKPKQESQEEVITAPDMKP